MNVLEKIKKSINSLEFLMYLLGISLSTLLLGYAASSIFLGIFIFFAYRYSLINKATIKIDYALLLPILLYAIFLTSLFWTVNQDLTIKGLERSITLVLVPIAFIVIPTVSSKHVKIVLNIFTIFNFLLGAFFLIIAFFNYFKTKSLSVFTYHELVSILDLNAIYVSIVFSISLFYVLTIKQNIIKINENILALFFALLVFLLSSKAVIFVLLIGLFIYFFKLNNNLSIGRKIMFLTFLVILGTAISSITLSERFLFEKNTKLNEVLNKDKFGRVYYWTGSSIRLLQLRILKDQIEEESIFLKGFGLYASRGNIKERHKEFDTYFKFHDYNYHNQYAQILSETGIFGLLLLLVILALLWFRAVKSNSYLLIMFSLMMTLVFFTESVLWRQRGLYLFIIFYCLFIRKDSKRLLNNTST